ncbi:MAG: PHP domain-containing protein [Clostridiales bacterium]|nr:PHP domain-containing protein [Clostridiales bacterium]
MVIYGDYHTHTTYSHGKGTILDNAMVAKSKGLKEIAITDHGFDHKTFAVKRANVENIIYDIKKAKEATGVNILFGIEANLTSLNGDIDLYKRDFDFLDVVNVGYHKLVKANSFKDFTGLFLKNNLHFYTKAQIEKNTICILKAIETHPVNIITHLGVGMPVNVDEVAKLARQKGVFIELNGKRISFDGHDMEALLKHDTQFILNSDAHTAEKVGDVRNGMNYVIRYNIPEKNIVNLGKKPEFKR